MGRRKWTWERGNPKPGAWEDRPKPDDPPVYGGAPSSPEGWVRSLFGKGWTGDWKGGFGLQWYSTEEEAKEAIRAKHAGAVARWEQHKVKIAQWEVDRKAHYENQRTAKGRRKEGNRMRSSVPVGMCPYCDTPMYQGHTHADHVNPIAAGGDSTKGNMVTVCAPCNGSKGKKPLARWCMETGKDLASVKARLSRLGVTA